MWRSAVFAFSLASVYGQAPVSSYDELINRLFGDDRTATRGADASIVLRIARPYSTDLRIVVLTKGTTTSVTAFETPECMECVLGIAETKGQEALRAEYLRLASITPRRANRQLPSAVAAALFEEAAKVIAGRAQAFRRYRQPAIVLHAPCYQIEMETGLDRVTDGFHAVDFEDKKFPSSLDFVRKLVAASGLRASN